MSKCAIQESFKNYKSAFKITFNRSKNNFINDFNKSLLNHLKTLDKSGKTYEIKNYVQLVNEVLIEHNDTNDYKFDLITEELINSLKSQSQTKLKTSSSVIPELDVSKTAPIYIFKKSTIAYNYMIGNLKNELVNSVYLNRESEKYVSNDDEVNENLKNYKNNLFHKLIDYINTSNENEEIPNLNLYESDNTINSDLYKRVMKEAFDLFRYDLETFESNLFNSEFVKNKYDIFNSMFILNNFDSVLKLKSALGSAITIDESNINKLDGIVNKYSIKNSVLQTAFFTDDNHKSKDSMLSSSPLIKLITDTIPYYNKNGNKVDGEYLGIARFIKLSNLIQELDFSNILGENLSFNDNPAKFIKELIKNTEDLNKKKLSKEKKLSEENEEINSIQTKIEQFFKMDLDLLYSFSAYLKDNSVVFKATLKEISSLNGNITDFIDLYSLFGYEISKTWSPTYIVNEIKDGQKTLSLKNFLDYENTSGTVLEIINNTLISNIVNKKHRIYNVIKLENFYKMTGLLLPQHIVDMRGESDILKFLSVIKDRFTLMKDDNPENFNDYIKFDNENNSFNTIVQDFIAANKFLPITVFNDHNGNSIPTNRQSSLSSNFKQNSLLFKRYSIKKDGSQVKNLLVDNLNLTGNPYVKLEMITDKSDSSISAEDMMKKEDIYSSFVYDYLKAHKQNLFLFQPVAYSDKSTNTIIPIKLDKIIKIGDKDVNFKTITNKDLNEVYYDYQHDYFTHLIESVVNDWAKLLNIDLKKKSLDSSIKIINEKLSKLSPKDIETKIKNIFKNGDYIEIVNEFHYSNYEGKLELNRLLLDEYNNFKSPDNFKLFQLKNYLGFENKLKSAFNGQGFNSSTGLDYDDLFKFSDDDQFSTAQSFLKGKKDFPFFIDWNGISYDSSNDDIKELNKKIEEGQVIINPYYERYLTMTNLFTDQYLAVTVKHPYLYSIKGSGDITKETTLRLDASSKRNVIIPATKMRYLKNKLDGIGTTMKLAVVKSLQMPVETYSGFSSNQDVLDGGAYIGPITTRRQEKSSPASGITGVQKPIGLSIGNGYASLLKFAQFPITNKLLRDYKESDITFDYIMQAFYGKKFDSNINLTKNLYQNQFTTKDALKLSSQKEAYGEINGANYSINIIGKNEDGTYLVNYTPVDKFGKMISADSIIKQNIPINSIYELWKIFGGEYSKELKNGKLEYSESSLDIITSYVNNVGHPNHVYKSLNILSGNVVRALDNYMIDMIADASSVKNGIVNINSELTNDLLYFNYDMSNIGVQQNQNHIADESSVSQPTQVISALASLGYTFNEADEIFNEISKTIDKTANEFNEILDAKDKEKLYSFLADIMIKQFNGADILGNGQNYINIINQAVEKDPSLKIPFSNPNIFGLFTSTIISRINNDIFKSKFKGIAATLNLSAKSVQLHSNGEMLMTSQDILSELYEIIETDDASLDLNDLNLKNEALRLINENKLTDISHILINLYSQFKNPDIENFDSNDLELYDRIVLNENISFDGKNIIPIGTEIYIDSPAKLRKVIGSGKVLKINSKGRDLKTQEIIWEENYKPQEEYLVSDYYDKPWKDDSTKSNKARLFSLKTKPEEYFELVEDIDKDTLIPNGEYSVHFKTTGIQALTEKEKVELINIISSQIPVGAKLSTWGEITKGGISGLNRFKNSGFRETNEYRNVKDSDNNDIIIPILQKISSKRNFWTSDAIVMMGSDLSKLSEDETNLLNSYLIYLGKLELVNKKDKASQVEIKQLLQKWVHRTTSLLKRGLNYPPIQNFKLEDGSYNFSQYFLNDNLYNKFELDYSNEPQFIKVNNLKMNNFEVILPKVYRSALKLGSNSLYKILKTGPKYYKDLLVNDFEQSMDYFGFIKSKNLTLNIDLKNSKYDKTTLLNSILIEHVTDPVTKEIKSYRIDQDSNRLYLIPKNAEIHQIKTINSETNQEVLTDVLVISKNNLSQDLDNVFKSIKNTLSFDFLGSESLSDSELLEMLKIAGSLNKLPVYRNDYYNLYNTLKYKLDILDDSQQLSKNENVNEIYVRLGLLNGNAKSFGTFLYNNSQYSKLFYTEDGQINLEAFNDLEQYSQLKKDYKSYLESRRVEILETIKNSFESKKDTRLDELSKMMFTSFLKSQEIVSARIPAQAFQSFMAMKNVGYTEDLNNNMYVSIWQLVLQGSDFDIDKAFNIMYDIDDNGIYQAWSPLFDYSSIESLNLSEKLPTPTNRKFQLEIVNQNPEELFVPTDKHIDLTNYINFVSDNNLENLQHLIDLIKFVNEKQEENSNYIFYSSVKDKGKLRGKVNSHNTFKYSTGSANNKIFSGIKTIITDLENQVSANSPVDMSEHKAQSNKMDSGDRNLRDGISKFEIKENNHVGKVTVGVMANGAKVFFGLTHYFNKKYKKNDLTFTEFHRNFIFDGKAYHKSTISDTYLSGNQKQIIRDKILSNLKSVEGATSVTDNNGNEIITYPVSIKDGQEIVTINVSFLLDSNNELIFSEKDASLPISSLISLATDNAKELALAKLNAGMDFAGMHIYLTVLGFSAKQIAKYMTHPAINIIVDKLANNKFIEDPAKKYEVIKKVLKDYVFDSDLDRVTFTKQFLSIQDGATELKDLNRFLGLNQGLKTDIGEYKNVLDGMSNVILNRQLTLGGDINLKIGDTQSLLTFTKRIIEDKPYLNKDEVYNLLKDLSKKGILGNKLNVNLFLNETNEGKQYQKDIIKFYDLIKHTVNIFDVVKNLPHINSLFKTAVSTFELIRKGSNKFNFANQIEEILTDYRSLVKEKDKNIKTNLGKKNSGVKYDAKMFLKMINLYDDLVITEWLKSSNQLSNFVISIEDIKELSKNENIEIYKDIASEETVLASPNEEIKLNNPVGIANFIKVVETYIIPYLKSKYSDNKFFQDMIYERSKYGNKFRPKLNYSSKEKDEIKLKDYYEVQKSFNEVYNNSIHEDLFKFADGSNKSITIGDILFMYNTIINKDKFGPAKFTKIFDKYVNEEKSIAKDLLFTYSKFEQDENISKNLGKNYFDILFALYNKPSGDIKKVVVKNANDEDKTLIIGNKNYHFLSGSTDTIMEKVDKDTMLLLRYFKLNSFILELNCD